MLFLLALLFFSLGASVTALPIDAVTQQPHDLEHHDETDEALLERYSGCWTPVHRLVSEHYSFNVTPFEL